MLVPELFNNNSVEDLFRGFFDNSYSFMNTDIQEMEDKYQMDIELPGFSKEDISADLKDGYLTISADHSDNKDYNDNDGNYIRHERYSGQYQRSFYVGDEVTQKDIHAKFENGILRLQIPKVDKAIPEDTRKYIEIQ